MLPGGGQEQDRRSGTENVAGIVGLGRAAELRRAEGRARSPGWSASASTCWRGSCARVDRAYLIGHRWRRLPGHLCLGLRGMEGEAIKLLLELDKEGIAVSSGSACSAIHAGGPSHVLEAMGLDPLRARGSLRLTLGRFNTWTRPTGCWRFSPRRGRARPMDGLGISDWGLVTKQKPRTASGGRRQRRPRIIRYEDSYDVYHGEY